MTTSELIEIAEKCADINGDWGCESCELKDDLYCRDIIFSALLDEIKNAEKYKWHDLRKNPDDLPKAETEVDVACFNGRRVIRTHGFYEDGKIHTEDSEWFWNEVWNFCEYCEETDDYIIPCGWWEYRHYDDGDNYNFAIDDKVIAWREIEPFEVSE